ncbi:MAG: hypothetical protein H6907_22050 [Hyphomicrobiales bacterium]|nr:hypothetical protein [Hyphomicrobiales bacterium]MCP5374427.1 hypothetical protein [Hyphomicrobiales bacterium]
MATRSHAALALPALILALILALVANAPARAAVALPADALAGTVATSQHQMDRMLTRLAQIDPAIAQYNPDPAELAARRGILGFFQKIGRGARKVITAIRKGISAVLRAGQSIADFVDRLASGIVRGVAGVIFKPLPPAVRNVLFTAATIYGEHFLTQKFWSSGLGQSISNWSDKLTRIDTRLAGLYDEIKEIEGKLENFEGELSAAAREKLEERLGVLRDRVSRQRPDQIRVMETLQRITRGIRPTRPQVPSGVVTPPRTTEGTGRGRGPCCGG